MRYLPKHKNDTYNYANPSIGDKLKRFFKNIMKKIFTVDNAITLFAIVLGLTVTIALTVIVFVALLPFYGIYYALIAIMIIGILSN